MQLDHVWADRPHDLVDKRILGVDHHGDGLDPAFGGFCKHLGGIWRHVAEAPRKEYEADIVGAGVGRRRNDRGRPYAADFNLHWHSGMVQG